MARPMSVRSISLSQENLWKLAKWRGIRRAKEGRTRIRDFGIGATAQGLGYHFSLAQELFFPFQEITYVKEQKGLARPQTTF